MIFTKIKNKIIEAQKIAGYSRTAKELLKLSDRQLEDIGFSRALLMRGVSAYPWREQEITHVMTDNVTNIDFPETAVHTPIMPSRRKAA
jgi:uncharacterized protein YjiS (DUF1127 family)